MTQPTKPEIFGDPEIEAAQEHWKASYIGYMLRCGVDRETAEDTYEAGIGHHDYRDDPEQAAADEMSYWDDDGE